MDGGGFLAGGLGQILLAVAGLGTMKASVVLPALFLLALGV